MTSGQDGEQAPGPAADKGVARRSFDLFGAVPGSDGPGSTESLTTVLVAFGVNVLVSVAVSVAAVVTGSASIPAEAAHSWADAATRCSWGADCQLAVLPPGRFVASAGHGREAYVWSLFAGAGAVRQSVRRCRSRTASRSSSGRDGPSDFVVGYVVLAISFVLEGVSLLRRCRIRNEAESLHRDVLEHVLPPDPTLRAVFAEDSAALVGLVIAAVGLAGHQMTGSAIPDAIGSILIGVLSAVVAIVLINRNRWFLIGQEVDPPVRAATLQALLDALEVARVTYLRLEIVGPRMVYIIGDVDLTGRRR